MKTLYESILGPNFTGPNIPKIDSKDKRIVSLWDIFKTGVDSLFETPNRLYKYDKAWKFKTSKSPMVMLRDWCIKDFKELSPNRPMDAAEEISKGKCVIETCHGSEIDFSNQGKKKGILYFVKVFFPDIDGKHIREVRIFSREIQTVTSDLLRKGDTEAIYKRLEPIAEWSSRCPRWYVAPDSFSAPMQLLLLTKKNL